MAMLDQQRAALAFEHVSKLDESAKDKYATIVHKLPALLTSAGLCQALHFIQARGNDGQKQVLKHLAVQLKRVDPKIVDESTLLRAARTAELGTYLRLSREAFACAAWYRRMVQGVLKIEPGG